MTGRTERNEDIDTLIIFSVLLNIKTRICLVICHATAQSIFTARDIQSRPQGLFRF